MMTRMVGAGIAALLSAASIDAAADSSLFQIEIPTALRESGGYKHQEAMFGAPKYGVTLTQKLYYSNSTLCDTSDAMTKHGMPGGPWVSPYLLMVDRGDCTFVTKVRNAQKLGASGVVIADNRCLCSDSSCVDDTGACQVNEPIMADDGSGSDISIPAILVYKSQADKIIRYLSCGALPGASCAREWSNSAIVQAQLEWSIPSPDNRVEWELWTTSIDESSMDFLTDFKSTALALGLHQEFTPHFYTYNGTAYGCTLEDANLCGNLCTNGGRYCAPDPDGSRNQGISGADVVRENLRRTCLWKLEGGKDQMDASQVGVGETWWDYVGNFSELCGTLEGFNDPDCVSRAMSAAGVDFARVEDCMQSSGGVDADVPNTMLEHELGELKSKSVYVVPECIVNGAVIWGALSVSNVLETICHGYSHGDQPKACQCVDTAGTAGDERYANCLSDSGDNAHSGTSGQKSVVQSGMPWWGVFLLFVSIIVVMLLAGLAYWKKTQQQMRDQVRGILAEYMPLEDLGPTSTPGGNHDRTNIQA